MVSYLHHLSNLLFNLQHHLSPSVAKKRTPPLQTHLPQPQKATQVTYVLRWLCCFACAHVIFGLFV